MSIAQRLVNLSDGLSAEGILSAAKGGTGTTTGAGSSTPTISAIGYGGDDTATNPAGGATITLTGTNFASGARVLINQTPVSVVTVVSQTQITFTAPALAAGSYILYVVNLDGSTAIAVPGIQYSGTPAWTTAAGSLGTNYETGAVSTTVSATSDSAVTYSVVGGTLPDDVVINSAGTISGTSPLVSGSTTYTFTVRATDAELQDTDRQFSLTVNPDVVTWSSANAIGLEQNASSTTALAATSAAGQTVSYSVDTLPEGLTLSGAVVSGTATAAGTTTTVATATAAVTGKTAQQTITWTVSIAADANFRYNTLLLNGESAIPAFLSDASTNNFNLTAYGDTKPSNLNPYTPGYYSNYFDGSGDTVTTPSTTAFNLGTSDFCIEMWFNWTGGNTSGYSGLCGSAGDYKLAMSIWNSKIMYGASSNGSSWNILGAEGSVGSATIIPNTWNHLVLCRTGTTITAFLNGVRDITTTSSAAIVSRTEAYVVGAWFSTLYYFTGYISNFRFVTGSSPYDANALTITVPTQPLTSIANTALLTCQANRFTDNSSNAFAMTKNGDVRVMGYVPFLPNSSYSTYGSTYFDGSGDYVTYTGGSTTTLSADFTLECWVYLNNLSANQPIICIGDGYNLGALFFIDTAGKLRLYANNVQILTGTGTAVANTWNHVAFVRSGTTVTAYLNGVAGGTATSSSQWSGTTTYIGKEIYNTGTGIQLAGYLTDLRLVKGTAVYTANFTPPTEPLTAVAGTSLLTCQTNQPHTNNTFLDNSTRALSITRGGNATQGSFSPYGANWSNYFDGSGDYLTLPSNQSQFSMGAGDFTIEMWVNITSLAGERTLYDTSNAGDTTATGRILIRVTATSGVVQFATGAGNNLTSGGTLVPNTWYHIAITKANNSTRIFVNGTQVNTTYTDNNTYTVGTSNRPIIGINSYDNSSAPMLGYISNLRVVKGTAVYTSAFTPPTAPLTPITGTSLLTCQAPSLVDNSINAFAITKTGDVSVQRFSPFATVTQTPTTHSVYFDGSGDWLTIPNNTGFAFGSGNFTVEMWVYITGSSGTVANYSNGQSSNSNFAWELYQVNSTTMQFSVFEGATQYASSSASFSLNTWNHIACVRNNNTLTTYINGVAGATTANVTGVTVTEPASSTLKLCSYGNGSNYVTGYVSNVRVVKGTALYTSNFTVPTQPLTAVSGTSLLTCQDAVIRDNSANNFALTAAGNATPRQQNPFGYTTSSAQEYTTTVFGSSAHFDGSGDYLATEASGTLTTGTNSFTMECWVYMKGNPTTSYPNIVSSTNWTTGGVGLRYGNTGQANKFSLHWYGIGDPFVASASTYPTNTWHHVAIVRSGSNFTLYVNGVSQATGTNSTVLDWNLTSAGIKIGGGNWDGAQSDNNFYLADLRLVPGKAVYTSNFVPPSAPLQAIPGTALLLNMDKAAISDKSGKVVLETVGDAKVSTAIKKYGTSSMYFDGTGDTLKIPANAQFQYTGDYTVEFWVYFNSVSTEVDIVGNYISNVGTDWIILKTANGTFQFYPSSANSYINGPTPVVNTWYHIAGVRSGSSLKLYVNGVSVGTPLTFSGTLGDATKPLYVGSRGGTTNFLNGYIDDLRISRYARYTANFTPPTQALLTK